MEAPWAFVCGLEGEKRGAGDGGDSRWRDRERVAWSGTAEQS